MGLVLLLLFIALPIAEIYVIVQVGDWIGWLPTLAILLLDGFVGAALARAQGRAAWARFNEALASGRPPARETADGAMIILGGALLLAPGFITDIVGFSLLLPPTRAMLRSLFTRIGRRRVAARFTVAGFPPGGGPGQRQGPWTGYGPRSGQAQRKPGYDYEGSAREVDERPAELDPPGRDG